MKDEVSVKEEAKPKRTKLGTLMALFGVLVSALYLLNFTMGIFEIPDNLPIVGNLDEVFFSGVFFACLRYLGFDCLPFRK